MQSQAQVNGILPQIAGSASDALSNILAVGMTGDGKVTASWFQASTQTWTMNPPSFVNEGGDSTSSRPDVDISIIAMNGDHRIYAITADGAAIVEYTWSSNNPYMFNWASNIEVA
jgi:hypothetical protein